MPTPQPPRSVRPSLGLWDTVSLIVGIIVGVGIFEAPSRVAANVSGPWAALGSWALGGVLSLIGALCFAELASAYPRSGGEYVYLTRAFGPGIGFLFAWAQLAVIRTGGGIAALAYVVADAMGQLGNFGPGGSVVLASLAIVGLSLVNLLGANPGKRTQNWLTVAKLAGLAGVVVAGVCLAPGVPTPGPRVAASAGSFALAMIFILYTYDGWNEAAYIAGEVHHWRRTVPLALIVGTVAVTGLYLLVNAAYLFGLGFDAARSSPTGLGELLDRWLGSRAALVLAVLVTVSALGAVNGTIFTGSRIFAELGADHRIFAPLGIWSRRLGTPVGALLGQGLISIGMVFAVGIGWRDQSGFDAILKCSAPVFWLFFLLTGAALFVLRRREPEVERPFRVPGYPVTPLVFCAWCGYMLYGSIIYAQEQALVGVALLLVGLPLYLFSQRPAASVRPQMSAGDAVPIAAPKRQAG